MTPTTPFWFKLRQCKVEVQGNGDTFKVTGPNLRDAYLQVRPDGSQWQANLRLEPTGDVIATAQATPNPRAAWDAAFELYRTQIIV